MAFCMNRGDYTYEKVLEGFGKEKAPFIIWREEDLFVLRPYPVKTKFWGFFFCVEGHMEIEINLRHRLFDAGKILCLAANYAVRIVSRSEDFRCTGILFSEEYWKKAVLRDYFLGRLSVRSAIVPMGDKIQEAFSCVRRLLQIYMSLPEGNGKEEGVRHLVVSVLYLIEEACREYKETENPVSRNEQLMWRFLELVYKEYKCHRRVAYYAGILSVTPRYLTTVLRQVGGRTASRWIEEYVVLEAQVLLRNSTMTIKDIAYGLHFNDPSIFSKYFTRVAGMSPEAYRAS